MGADNYGILAYGFDLETEGVKKLYKEFVREGEDFEDCILREAGVPLYRGEGEDLGLYLEKRKEALSTCPVRLVNYGYWDDNMYLLAIRGGEFQSDMFEEILPSQLIIEEDKIAAAKVWCEQHNIPWQEPSWILTWSRG